MGHAIILLLWGILALFVPEDAKNRMTQKEAEEAYRDGWVIEYTKVMRRR